MAVTIINADDFGLSPGMNEAIIYCFQNKLINRASLMVTTDYTAAAVAHYKKHPEDLCGLHLDLMYGNAVCVDDKMLVDESGRFCKGFFGLLWATIYRPKQIRRVLEEEIVAQLDFFKKNKLAINHVDGHNHIHMIPMVNKILRTLAPHYGVRHIRTINESLFRTLFVTRDITCLNPKRILRHMFFNLLSLFQPRNSSQYFYSILFSCELTKKRMIIATLDKYRPTEIMVHPGNPTTDLQAEIWDNRTKRFLLSASRTKELEALKSFAALNNV